MSKEKEIPWYKEAIAAFGYGIEIAIDFIEDPLKAAVEHIARPMQGVGKNDASSSSDKDKLWGLTQEIDEPLVSEQHVVNKVRNDINNYRKILVMKRDFDNNDSTYDLFTLIAHRNELARVIRDEYPTVTKHSSLDSFATAMRESNTEFTADQVIALLCYYRTI